MCQEDKLRSPVCYFRWPFELYQFNFPKPRVCGEYDCQRRCSMAVTLMYSWGCMAVYGWLRLSPLSVPTFAMAPHEQRSCLPQHLQSSGNAPHCLFIFLLLNIMLQDEFHKNILAWVFITDFAKTVFFHFCFIFLKITRPFSPKQRLVCSLVSEWCFCFNVLCDYDYEYLVLICLWDSDYKRLTHTDKGPNFTSGWHFIKSLCHNSFGSRQNIMTYLLVLLLSLSSCKYISSTF